MTIAERTKELVRLCGTNMYARERIILSLMIEFGISDRRALQQFTVAKKNYDPTLHRIQN